MLVQQVTGSSRYKQDESTTRKSKLGRTLVVVTATNRERADDPPVPKNKRDDRSDRSILGGVGNSIVQTSEVRVESHDRGESDAESVGYELGIV